MRVTADMKIKEVLKINERMLESFVWFAPEFERLRNARLRRLMAGRVTVRQAARIAQVPLTELLYVLNLTAGEDEQRLTCELQLMDREAFKCAPENPPRKPRELLGLSDTDPLVHFVDVMPQAKRNEDPQPAIMRALAELHGDAEVLLVRHPFDPIPLRDLLVERGLASWAEERRPHEWYIYFYRPSARAGATVYTRHAATSFVRAMAAGA